MIALLKKNIERQQNNDYSGMNEDFDAIEIKIYEAHVDSSTVCRNFLDCWCDEVNHDFVNYRGLSKPEWPLYAKRIIDELENDGEITSKGLKDKFIFKPREIAFTSDNLLNFLKAFNKILSVSAYLLFLFPVYVVLKISWKFRYVIANRFGELLASIIPIIVVACVGAMFYYFREDGKTVIQRFKGNGKRNILILFFLPIVNLIFNSLKFLNLESCETVMAFSPLGIAFLFLGICLGGTGFLLLLIGLFMKTREKIWFWGLVLTSIFSLELLSSGLVYSVRRASMKNASVVGKPIIEAIKEFKTDKGHYPASLEELVPSHLNLIPHTQMCGYPKFEYVTGKDIPSSSGGYELFIKTPLGLLNWDVFYYWPSESYPERDKGGWVEKIDNWAYVHE